MNALDADRRRRRSKTAFTVAVTVVAIGLTALLVVAEHDLWWSQLDWTVFGVFGLLLVLSETKPSFSLKFGASGTITPGWTFAYALVLFGMPLEALVVLLGAHLATALRAHTPRPMIVFDLSVLATSLAAGALVLHAFGMRGAMTELDTIPWYWALGILLGASAMIILNGLLVVVAIGLQTGAAATTTLRSGLAIAVAANGGLLSLAPLFVIAVNYSLVLVPVLASVSYLVINSARKALQRAYEASHDPLTELLNRRAFNDRLSRAIAGGPNKRGAIVAVMDLDRFKEINDALGHAVGDTLLTAFAARLTTELPPWASAARLGGDEFAVLVPGTRTPDETRRTIDELRSVLVEPFDIAGFPLTMSVSIGVANAPDHGVDVNDLLAAADLAMYRAKQFDSGIEYHEPTVGTSRRPTHPGRLSLLRELSVAIDRGQLTNHYQPQVDAVTGEVDTIEALVRWQHPEHGLIHPDDFIAMAEQTDLIDGLTEAVLERSMRDILSLDRPDLSVAINISARSLHHRSFAANVLDRAAAAGFPVHRLELEITERAIAIDPDWMSLTVARLRDAGVRIAIDDFGTGYSSFASLRQIPADRLKIDKSFTRHLATSPEDRLVVATIADLGRGLGLRVVAEGVESYEIWEHVRAIGCDYAQGYAIAKPMPIDELRIAITRPLIDRQLPVRP